MLIFALSFSLNFVTAALCVFLLPPPRLIGQILAFGGVFMGQIVLLSVILSELGAIGRTGFLSGHGVFFAVAVGLSWRKGMPIARTGVDFRSMRVWVRENRMVAAFAVGVVGISLFNVAYSWGNLPLSGDAYNYHLPRSYFWAEFQTARHFETPFNFMNEYPPNPSFYFMWVMVMRADFGDWGLQVPQWFAGWMAAVALMGWIRLLGKPRAEALWVGLSAVTLPMMSMQMRSIEIDLLTTCVGLSAVYFMLAYVQVGTWANLVYAGGLVGLFLGSKYTAFFTLPPLALLILGYSWVLRRREWLKPLVPVAISAVIGFFFLGSYHYWVNLFTIGDPISSRSATEATAGVEQDRLGAYFSPSGNALRYSYMMMDWGILPRGNRLAAAHTAFYRQVEGGLGADLEAIFKFSWNDYGSGRRQPNRMGFGAVGYLAYVVSPLVFGVALWRFWHKRHAQDWLIMGYILLGLGWIAGFILLIPWDPYRMRYFPLAVLPLLAGVLPWVGQAKLLRWGVMWLSLWIGADAAGFAFDHAAIRDLRQLYAQEIDILGQTLPPQTRIAFVDPSIPYITISQLPQFHYQIFHSETAPARFEAGEVDVVLETIQPGKSTAFQNPPALYLPELIFNVRVHEPAAFEARFRSLYSWDEKGVVAHPERLIQSEGRQMRVNLLDEDLTEAVMIRLSPPPQVEHVTCEGFPADYDRRADELLIFWIPDIRAPYQLFQTCTIEGGQVKVETFRVEADHAPPPEVRADLWFNGELYLAGFTLPNGYEVEPCGRLPIVTWWLAEEMPQAIYTMSVVMITPDGTIFSRDERPFRVAKGEFFRRQWVSIPCDQASGLYDLKFGLVDLANLQDYPITYADGSPHERGVHLTTIFVR